MSFDKIIKELEDWKKKKAFIFIPSPVLSEKESFYMPVISVVDLESEDIYPSSGAFRIKFTGLSKFAVSAALEWSLNGTGRTDDRNDKLYSSYEATGGIRRADGSVSFYKAEKDIDIEVVEMQLIDSYNEKWIKRDPKNEWKFKNFNRKEDYVNHNVRRDIIQKRYNKLMLVESGAKSRVIRFLLGIPGQTKDINKLLKRPFVFVSYVINYSRPDVKGVLLGNLSNSMTKIYGSKQPERIDYSSPDTIDIEPEEIESLIIESVEDFEKLNIDDQIKYLKKICEEKDLIWDHERSGADLSKQDKKWINGFYEYLINK